MRKLILATGCDEKYVPSIKPYLNSIELNSNFDLNLFILLSDDEKIFKNDKIKMLRMSPQKFIHKTKINCLQHGEFIKSENFDNFVNDDDVIFYTDGDIILQRPLTDDEYNQFRNINHDDVLIGYNASIDDNLQKEYYRLSPMNSFTTEFMNEISKIKCYNTGVVGMTKKTWSKLSDLYGPLFTKINSTFNHYAKQQWLICYILGTKNFNIIELGFDLHNHKHFPSPTGTKMGDDKLVYFNDKKVLFRHAWEKNYWV